LFAESTPELVAGGLRQTEADAAFRVSKPLEYGVFADFERHWHDR
jgi:hypothetical protein